MTTTTRSHATTPGSYAVEFGVPSPPKNPTKYSLTSSRGQHLTTRIWWHDYYNSNINNNSKTTSNKSPPHGIVLFVHGGGWHSGYYDYISKRLLNEINVLCASYDQPSCGYSDLEVNVPKGMMHINDFNDLVDDVYDAIIWLKKEIRDIMGIQEDDNTTKLPPLFLVGECFGGLQVLSCALNRKNHPSSENITISGTIVLGGLLQLHDDMLPPKVIINSMSYIAKYYPKLPMVGIDFEKTFDEAFGDKEWAKVARLDPAINISPQPTLGAMICTLTTGTNIMKLADQYDLPLLCIHAKHDCRTKCSAMKELVDIVHSKSNDAEGYWLDDTVGHQLLQDIPAVTDKVINKISEWIQKRI